MRNQFYFFASILFSSSAISAQAPAWEWAKSAASTISYSWGVTCDGNGNIYATGHFFGPTISFGNIVLTNSNNDGSDDVFIVKYDSSGDVLWAKSAGGQSSDGGQRIVADVKGNIFVVGDFSSPQIIFGHDTLASQGTKNVFLIKYDAEGNVIWATNAGGISTINYGQGISLDADGNVYITGAFEKASTSFGDTILNNENKSDPEGSDDIFIAKYDSAGKIIWSKSAGGMSDDWCDAICTDAGDNMYIAGYFLSPEIFFDIRLLRNVGGADIFVAKYSWSGNVAWLRSCKGVSGGYGERITTDRNGNVYMAGTFRSNLLVADSITLKNHSEKSADVFLAKYDSSGKLVWAKSMGGDKNEEALGITTDTAGNIYVTGYFSSPSIKVGNVTLINSGTDGDIFIIKYDPAGSISWAKSMGGNHDDNGLCITADTKGNVYVTGDFKSNAIVFDKETLKNSGTDYNFFLAKLKK